MASGYEADLVATDGNPLEWTSPPFAGWSFLMKGGKVYNMHR